VKKIIISRLFLYKHRFVIGYIALGIAFIGLLFALPLLSPNGLSDAEMQSATISANLEPDAILKGNIVDLPYRLLQKFSIMIFGLSNYSVKLPSIILGFALGLLLVILLNRWFKNNVSLLASALVVLSTPFLYLTGTGTPLIMLVFWPTFLLWLGSKIQGVKRPEPRFCFIFAFAMLLSLFTPYMGYFALFCVLFVAFQPHLRFVVKNLPLIPLIITTTIILVGLIGILMNIIKAPSVIMELLFAKDYEIARFFPNLSAGFAPVFAWSNSLEGTILSPLISLPTFALGLIGLLSTTKGFFASRNSIASILLVFTVIITGFNPEAALFIILPFSVLAAHGIKYVLEKWYGLFPENPYARIFALFPLAALLMLTLQPSLLQYAYGYRYNPSVAYQFDTSLPIVKGKLTNETVIIKDQTKRDFYKLLERETDLRFVESVTPDITGNIASFGKLETVPAGHTLTRIITSEKSDNSDIIYLYTVEGE
jgi:hypothetical protein